MRVVDNFREGEWSAYARQGAGVTLMDPSGETQAGMDQAMGIPCVLATGSPLGSHAVVAPATGESSQYQTWK